MFPFSMNIFTKGFAKMKNSTKNITDTERANMRPALKPCLTRSLRLQPKFCAVKLEIPLPRVLKLVMANVLSLMADE